MYMQYVSKEATRLKPATIFFALLQEVLREKSLSKKEKMHNYSQTSEHSHLISKDMNSKAFDLSSKTVMRRLLPFFSVSCFFP